MLDWNDPLAKPAQASNVEPVIVENALSESAPEISNKPDLKVVTQKLDPVNPEDKRVINGQTDINQLAPFKYPWAWNFFLNLCNKNDFGGLCPP